MREYDGEMTPARAAGAGDRLRGGSGAPSRELRWSGLFVLCQPSVPELPNRASWNRAFA